jgi:hypothetical protein
MRMFLGIQWRAAIACALFLWLTTAAQATVVVPAGVAELAVQATAIAHGRVVRIDARQGDDGRGRVERLVTVQVLDYLKGNLGNVVQLRVPGGTFGRYTTFTIGTPSFAEGDELVLFLGVADGEPFPRLLGFHQGVYRVVTDPSTGDRWVTPPIVQATASASEPAPVTRGDVTRRPATLDEFRNSVAAALRRQP